MNFSSKEVNNGSSGSAEERKTMLEPMDYTPGNIWHRQPTASANQQHQSSSQESGASENLLNNSASSPLSTSSNGNATEMRSNDSGGDAEGVWSADIDQAFHEALQIYPPCGRRKIILSDEGKMYGRNELIARYIKIRCGKTRTRKQVSSHIQVLARKRQREEHAKIKAQRDGVPDQQQPPGQIKAEAMASSANAGEINNHLNAVGDFQNNMDAAVASSIAAQTQNAATVAASPLANSQPLADLISDQLEVLRAMGRQNPAGWPYPIPAAAAKRLLVNQQQQLDPHQQQQLYLGIGATNPNGLFNNPATASASTSSATLQFQQHQTQSYVPKTETMDGAGNIGDGPSSAFSSSGATTAAYSTAANNNGNGNDIHGNLTIASPKLVLNEFTAYIEQNTNVKDNSILGMEKQHGNGNGNSGNGSGGGGGGRREIVHIPKTTNCPLEKISIDTELVRTKYPAILQDLFKKGPAEAFFLAKCWANMNFEDEEDEQNSLFAVDSYYESAEKFDIVVSTKVCSFGNEVVEKVEIYAPIEDVEGARATGKWHFRLEKSPMCEYMVRFISELKKLQEPSLMNSVLDNFTVLQIVTNKQTDETLMVIAFFFEIREDGEDEIYTRIYRLTE